MIRSEEWRPVVGFEDYEVSDQGRVKSLKLGRSHILKPQILPAGHQQVNLCRNGQVNQRYIHRLVALAFLENPENYPLVRHLDDDPSYNFVTNLAWGTHLDNFRDSIENKSAYWRETPVRIVETGEKFRSQRECSRAIQGDVAAITNCLQGNRKTHKGFHFEYVKEDQ